MCRKTALSRWPTRRNDLSVVSCDDDHREGSSSSIVYSRVNRPARGSLRSCARSSALGAWRVSSMIAKPDLANN